MAVLGVQHAPPVFSMVPAFGPFKPAALLPTVTEEDKVILNNVQKVVEFLAAGSSLSRSSSQVLKGLCLTIIFSRDTPWSYFFPCYVLCICKLGVNVRCLSFFLSLTVSLFWVSIGGGCCSGHPRASSSVAGHICHSAPRGPQSTIFPSICTHNPGYIFVGYYYLAVLRPVYCA